MRYLRVVLGGDDDGVDIDRFAVHVADGELALGVRAQPRQASVAADFGLPLHDAVRIVDRQRHQRRRFVAGVTEHQPLVAGALVEVDAFALVDALRDIRRLAVDRRQDGAAFVVKADV